MDRCECERATAINLFSAPIHTKPDIASGIKDGPCGLEQGGWDALHVAEALPTADGRSATYEVTSTVLLSLAVRGAVTMDASSSLTRRVRACVVDVQSTCTRT